MDKTFIFDYDDTLAYNMIDYSLAELSFLEFIIDRLGPRAPGIQELINLEVQIDKNAVAEMGFSSKRFPTSLRETYREICRTLRIIPKEKDLQTAYDIGRTAFDEFNWKKRGFIEGAEETLDFLIKQNDELMLLTKGDYEIQAKKISTTGCRKWFGDKVYIVPNKDKQAVLGAVGERNKSRVWLVGNSIKSDVGPALEAEIGVVYIPFETWAWEKEHKGRPEHPRLKVFESIIEIKQKYGEIK